MERLLSIGRGLFVFEKNLMSINKQVDAVNQLDLLKRYTYLLSTIIVLVVYILDTVGI